MGFLSKRKAKKEAKKAEANAAQAAADGAAAAKAVAKKEATAKVPGEIKIEHQRGAQSGNNKPQSSGGKVMTFRRRMLGQSGGKPAPTRSRPPRSPGGQSHVSAITRDTAFPETPKRRLFSPTTSTSYRIMTTTTMPTTKMTSKEALSSPEGGMVVRDISSLVRLHLISSVAFFSEETHGDR